MSDPQPVPVDEVVDQLGALGVRPGGVLQVHTSFRALRPIERGPAGLVDALVRAVGAEGTVVMPSWPEDADLPFEPLRTPAAADLGVVAQTFWQRPGVLRTEHVQAFAALGKHAAHILADPLPLPPHIEASPVGRVHELDGQVLLLGVGHDADTTIHLVECLARVPYGRSKTCCAIVDGRPKIVEYRENDHCCERFELVGEWLRDAGLESEGPVGHGMARLADARAIVEQVVPRLEAEPLLFLHPKDAGCDECDEARASVDDASAAS